MALTQWNWFRNESEQSQQQGRGQRGQRGQQRSGQSGFPMPFGGALPTSYFGPLSQFYQDMDRMFENAFRSFSNLNVPNLLGNTSIPPVNVPGLMFRPNINITSTDQEYIITAEVPGLEENDISLEVSSDGILTISGEKKQETESQNQHVYCVECSYGVFQRTLTLPEEADKENIQASFKNGILTIRVPLEEQSKSRQTKQITINAESSSSRQSDEGQGQEQQGRSQSQSSQSTKGSGSSSRTEEKGGSGDHPKKAA